MELNKEMSKKELLLQIMRSGEEPQRKYFLRFYQGTDQLAKEIYDHVLPEVGGGW